MNPRPPIFTCTAESRQRVVLHSGQERERARRLPPPRKPAAETCARANRAHVAAGVFLPPTARAARFAATAGGARLVRTGGAAREEHLASIDDAARGAFDGAHRPPTAATRRSAAEPQEMSKRSRLFNALTGHIAIKPVAGAAATAVEATAIRAGRPFSCGRAPTAGASQARRGPLPRKGAATLPAIFSPRAFDSRSRTMRGALFDVVVAASPRRLSLQRARVRVRAGADA